MSYHSFSVLMSLYNKEKPEYLKQCLDSIFCQSVMPDDIVIVYDGPISKELDSVVLMFADSHPGIISVIKKEKNEGLGLALQQGILHCKNELVARVDSDDINKIDRFEKQLMVFNQHPEVDICGSHSLEFIDTIDNIVSKRTVPLDDQSIKKYQKRRDGFNHPCVMYKKSIVLKAGNYESCLLMEDTLLWCRMFMINAIGYNIDDYLVYCRVGKDMYQRRGGYNYYLKYKAARKRVFQTGYISFYDYLITLFIQFVVAMLPNNIRGFVFRKILHH